MNDLVQSLGITGLSKSRVSEMATDLDEQVEPRKTRDVDTPAERIRARPSPPQCCSDCEEPPSRAGEFR